MEECFKCGISSDKARLFDAVSGEGIVKVCAKCSEDEYLPLIRKPTTFQLKKAEEARQPGSRLDGGVYSREARKAEQEKKEEEKKRQVVLRQQETSLRELVDKKYQKKFEQEKDKKPRPDLVNNFHWIIMMARRSKKLTQLQLAEKIAESEAAVKMAEKGWLPEDDYRLINKLESTLGIRIRKEEVKADARKQPVRILDFKKDMINNLTISDLKQMREGFVEEKNVAILKRTEDEALEEEIKKKVDEILGGKEKKEE